MCSVGIYYIESKVAVTAVALLIVTTHAPVPEQPPPDQPVNAEPLTAAADNATISPELKNAEQVAPHAIPAGLLVTVPAPVPILLSDSA